VVDVGHATDVLQQVGKEAYADDRLRRMLLDEPTVMGVERIGIDEFSMRMVARTLPGMQFEIGRELRARVATAFRGEGIIVKAEIDTIHPSGETE
jgi:small conductance mechanosensitive channel